MSLIIRSFHFWEGDDEIVRALAKNFPDDVERGDYSSAGSTFDALLADILTREAVQFR